MILTDKWVLIFCYYKNLLLVFQETPLIFPKVSSIFSSVGFPSKSSQGSNLSLFFDFSSFFAA